MKNTPPLNKFINEISKYILANMNIKNRPIISLAVILILAAFFGLCGIDWGLPSREKSQLILSDKKAAQKIIAEIDAKSRARRDFHDESGTSLYGLNFQKKPQPVKQKTPLGDNETLEYIHSALIHSFHPDEWNYFSMLAQMNPGALDFNPHMFIYSNFHAYTIGVLLKLSEITGYITLRPEVSYYLSNPDEISKFYVIGRAFTVFMGVLCVYLLYCIGKICYSPLVGILASLFLAVTPLFTIFMHYVNADIHALFWTLLSFYMAAKVLRSGQLKYYIFSGLFAGMAMGTKYPNIIIIIPLIIAHLTRCMSNRQRFSSILSDKSIWIGCIAAPIAFVITNPYSIIALNEFLTDLKGLSVDAYVPRWSFEALDNKWLYYPTINFPLAMGWPFYFFAIFGSIYALWKHRHVDYVVLVFIFVFLFYLGKIATKMVHYGLPLVPFFALLAARSLVDLTKRFRFIATFIVIAICLYTGGYSLAYSKIFFQEDTRLEAGKWIRDNLPAGTTIGLPSYLNNFEYPPMDLMRYNIWKIGYNQHILQQQDVDYVLITELRYGDIIRLEEKKSAHYAFWKKLNDGKNYSKIREFSRKPNLLGISFDIKGKAYPSNWLYPNPSIRLYSKNNLTNLTSVK